MPRFPSRENEIAALANDIITGLEANPDLLSNPIVDATTLRGSLKTYRTNKTKVTAAQAAVSEAVEDKNEALEELVEQMKQVIRQAENATDYDDTALKKIGWGGRSRPSAPEVPGQPRTLEASRQGTGWVVLDWKSPNEGGKVVTYRVERFDRANDKWLEVTSTLDSEATLVEQPRGENLEFRVVATNRVGDGVPSNTVLVVL